MAILKLNVTWGRCSAELHHGGAGQLLANFFLLSLVTVPEVFAKTNSAQFPFCF